MAILESPVWLLAWPPLLLLAWWWSRSAMAVHDPRRRLRLAWRAACLTALLLALAGLRFPGRQAQIEVVAAVDVSDSVYDRSVQEGALKKLAAQTVHAEARLGVVTFASKASAERAPAPYATENDRATPAAASLPDLVHNTVDGGETDIGAALSRGRGLFTPSANGRAIVLISDGHDTVGNAGENAAALRGSGIDLLAWPAALGESNDALLSGLVTPDRTQVGRDTPVLVSVSAQREMRVRVRLGRRVPQGVEPVGSQDVTLQPVNKEFRATLRFIDRPERPGVTVYVASLEGPEGQPLAGDYRQNNVLMGAVPVDGPSRWLVVARPDSTLAGWSKSGREALGVELNCIPPQALPVASDDYASCTGVLVGPLSAKELPGDSEGLKALENAVSGGVALIALGGEEAFGAGKHAEGGAWEKLLPVTFRPEDDRTRSVLFVLDVSATMEGMMAGRQEQKLPFACARLSEVAQPGPASPLRSTDRIGLIVFSDQAIAVAPLENDPQRRNFREKLNGLRTGRQTNFLAALELARQTMVADDAEEQLVIFVSDGEPTPMIPDEDLLDAVKALCPGEGERRRTKLHTFGIATGAADRNPAGEQRLQRMARAGGGAFFPNFPQLTAELSRLLNDAPPDFYVRRNDPFTVRSPFPQHPLLASAGPWPELDFRNRVRARPDAMTLTQSAPVQETGGKRKADPLLVLGHHGLGRTAVLALTLDGPAGRRFLAAGDSWKGGQAFLASLLSYVERGDGDSRAAWRVETEVRGEQLQVQLEARDPASRAPRNGLKLSAALAPVFGDATSVVARGELLPIAPGRYRAALPLPHRDVARADEQTSVYRLDVGRDGAAESTRHVSIPYPPEYRRFGTDRTALAALVQQAGGRSRMLDVPDNFKTWLKEVEKQRVYVSARPVLLILAALCLLAEVATRGMRRRSAR